MVLTHVLLMLPAITLMVVITAFATQAMKEMVLSVSVSLVGYVSFIDCCHHQVYCKPIEYRCSLNVCNSLSKHIPTKVLHYFYILFH